MSCAFRPALPLTGVLTQGGAVSSTPTTQHVSTAENEWSRLKNQASDRDQLFKNMVERSLTMFKNRHSTKPKRIPRVRRKSNMYLLILLKNDCQQIYTITVYSVP